MKKKNIPVLLLTGYLGSGKTTLLNRILSNERGVRFAVIVNDIGEVNIDASLIQKGGVVNQSDDSLVALQNGCICCTLKMDLVEQLHDIIATGNFDYIVIEASGICEPGPIAQTICSIPQMEPRYTEAGVPVLDSIVTVVDALRMKDEFGSGSALLNQRLEEDELENLVRQHIEFWAMVLLNKAAEVEPEELERIRQIVRTIQPQAEIIDCNYGDVPLERLLNTGAFDFEKVATSATWIHEIEKPHEDEDENETLRDENEDENVKHHEDEDGDEEEHHEHHHHHHDDEEEHEEHHHHHHHHHHHEGEGEALEYGIGTFVYFRREPMDLGRFDEFVARHWPKSVIRAKGICYFRDERDMCYVFEQAGRQVSIRQAGQWFATMPKEDLDEMLLRDANLRRDWDPFYGDRMQKLVFIGQKMDRKAIEEALDACLRA